MNCPGCGLTLEENTKFCVGCGNPIPEVLNCRSCGEMLQQDSKFCKQCGKKVDSIKEALNCRSCGAVLQQDWKACPECGNKIQGEQGAPFNISDSVAIIKQTDESKTVDKSVQISNNTVSGEVTIGETVNVSNVVNVESIDEQTVSEGEWESLTEKMDLLLESTQHGGLKWTILRATSNWVMRRQTQVIMSMR
jgi:predicted amidophosphoribosyltransferase